jgi:hypothetical protein
MAVGGVAAQFAGLAVDAWLHSRDPGLAAREGVFALENPGHVLFGGGLALAAAGLCVALYAEIAGPPVRARSLRQRLLAAVPAVAILVLAAGSLALAATSESGLIGGHDHAETLDPLARAAVHVHEEGMAPQVVVTPGTAHQHGAGGAPAEGGAHTQGAEVRVTYADLQQIHDMLEEARDATEKYRDVSVALAHGYVQVTQDIPGIAAHFANTSLIDGEFDHRAPEVLLYERTSDGWELVGLSYLVAYVPGVETPPEGFPGEMDAWHYHRNLCFTRPTVTITSGAEQCRMRGGVFQERTAWMAHAWIYRDAPEGVFAHTNSRVR